MSDYSFETKPVASGAVIPWVRFFCSRQQKSFLLPRENIRHTETFMDDDGKTHTDKTFVVFLNPNTDKRGTLHAVVDMSLSDFYDAVITPAYSTRKSYE